MQCSSCNQLIGKNDSICPFCGSTDRNIYSSDSSKVGCLEKLELKQLDESGFKKVDLKSLNKISGETKRPTKEVLIIDRTDPNYTKKYHCIEELSESGEYEIAHHHEDIYPAKRRPNNIK